MDVRALRRAYSSYRGAPFGARCFVAARYVVAPLGPLAGEFRGLSGSVLSLGSGLCMLERYLAELEPGLVFEGVDLDATKVGLIKMTQTASPRVSLVEGDATQTHRASQYDVVLLCDALHHFPEASHVDVLRNVAESLRPGGIALIKDLDTEPRWKRRWNAVHDRIVAGPEPIYCREPTAVAKMLIEVGLQIERSERIDRRYTPYAHYLVRARRPA